MNKWSWIIEWTNEISRSVKCSENCPFPVTLKQIFKSYNISKSCNMFITSAYTCKDGIKIKLKNQTEPNWTLKYTNSGISLKYQTYWFYGIQYRLFAKILFVFFLSRRQIAFFNALYLHLWQNYIALSRIAGLSFSAVRRFGSFGGHFICISISTLSLFIIIYLLYSYLSEQPKGVRLSYFKSFFWPPFFFCALLSRMITLWFLLDFRFPTHIRISHLIFRLF